MNKLRGRIAGVFVLLCLFATGVQAQTPLISTFTEDALPDGFFSMGDQALQEAGGAELLLAGRLKHKRDVIMMKIDGVLQRLHCRHGLEDPYFGEAEFVNRKFRVRVVTVMLDDPLGSRITITNRTDGSVAEIYTKELLGYKYIGTPRF